jgi:hypothetical protein
MAGHLHLVPKLRMSGATATRPIYACVAFKEITLLLLSHSYAVTPDKRSSDTPGEGRVFLLPTDKKKTLTSLNISGQININLLLNL